MANLIEVADPADERLADYVKLRETTLRRQLENEGGLFIAEGAKIIRRAVEAGYQPRSFLLAERWLPGLADLLDATEAPVFVVSEEVAEMVTGFHVHRGALASMHRHTRWSVEDLLDAQRLVVCEDIVDHTNVGAIVRSAAALGWDGVLLAPRAADPLYRRAIKTSMGAVLEMPWARFADWRHDLPRLQAAGFEVVAMALSPDAVSLPDYAADLRARPRPIALLLGTEGDGLSSRWLGQADVVVRIDMARGIDSLNVAAAAAVACYALGATTSISG